MYLRRSGGTPAAETYYLTHDHLGSTDKVLDAAGGVVTVAESFTALGARRGSTWQGTPTPSELAAIAATTRDGFTGHETLDSVGLVHMGGRVYDPVIGRFLSVDPVVRDIGAAQSWNSYGYVEGRVASWTDPSGYFPWGCSPNGHPAWDWGGSSECLTGINFSGTLERVVVEAPGWPQPPTPKPPMPVFSPVFQSPGISIGNYAEAGNGQGGDQNYGAGPLEEIVVEGEREPDEPASLALDWLGNLFSSILFYDGGCGVTANCLTFPQWGGPGKAAKSAQEMAKHLHSLALARNRVTELERQLANLKGPKAQAQVRDKIKDLLDQIKGHEKEIRQKWPELGDDF